MMAQYLEIKSQYPDALLFYRMGDFYELFFDDAIKAAKVLDIALTKRGKHNDTDIPMCGVPHHSSENYLLTLIKSGHKVAVCEQLESPAEAKKRGYKSVVKRDVVRLVTPGTLTEDSLLKARSHNFLAAYSIVRGEHSLAWVDISTGLMSVLSLNKVEDFVTELFRLTPSEVLIIDNTDYDIIDAIEESGATATLRGKSAFDSTSGEERLKSLFAVASLEAFGSFGRAQVSALGSIAEYLDATQKGKLPILRPPVIELKENSMRIDSATRRNLELTRSINTGSRQGSLLGTIDRTVTAAGGRLLERRISAPSMDMDVINERHNALKFLRDNFDLSEPVMALLKSIPDLERALSRVSLERAGPRDLANISKGLIQGKEIASLFKNHELPAELKLALEKLTGHDEISSTLEKAIVPEPPLLVRDGGFVTEQFNSELDETRELKRDGTKIIAEMQRDFIELTGIQSLKIKFNNVLGYFIETTAKNAEKLQNSTIADNFIHRQTTANQMRFTTLSLSDTETKIINANAKALEIEKQIFNELSALIVQNFEKISAAAEALAVIDITNSLATLARDEEWCRPKIDSSKAFAIQGGRHVVVESSLKNNGNSFIPNDCELSEGSIWLVTGPNMAGKSTFLRQNALIAILAQMGCFVPATSAHIGIVSQLFSRVGASDDLARGRSTFMVEMVETAAILNQADDRALVILDEVGRGTATYDGLAIAWSTLEYLHEVNKSRSLFATHYHEMTVLADKLTRVINATVSVKEWNNEVIFLHEVRQGAADRSYGLQVAKLAGLPIEVLERAKVILNELEAREAKKGTEEKLLAKDLPLFSQSMTQKPVTQINYNSELSNKIRSIYPDEISPNEALQILYDLKEISGDN
ncbi:MAG: DNA mismatch repair protein MutS [Paracoccaceae bacterium]|nr:DNA mismatch repair protein MutS [Paracoccaceae bacterium]